VVSACAGSGACPSPGTPAHTASLLLQVTRSAPASDFSISVAPRGTSALVPAHSIEYSVSTAVASGQSEPVSLGVTGLPSGVTGTFDVSPVNAGSGATLTLAASSSAAPAALKTFTVQGVSASVPAGHGATAQVQVDGLPAVSLAIATSLSGTVPISASATAGVGTTLASLSIFVDGQQASTLASSPLAASWDTTQVLNGAHIVSATATDADGGSRSTQASVVVTNDFSLAITSGSGAATIGRSSATFTVSTAAVGGQEPVALAVSGLPAGVQASFDRSSVPAGSSATLTVAPPAGVAPGRTTFAVTGTTRSVPAGHRVTADVVLVSAPSAAIVAPAGGTVSGKVTITAAATVDANAGLVRVDVKDGDTVVGTGATATTSVSWDTTGLANGTHALSAVVVDGAGNLATSPVVSVEVANGSGGGCSSRGVSGLEALALAAVLAAIRRRGSAPGRSPPG
jgi:hypothetical protein